jgi:tight adherence protein C
MSAELFVTLTALFCTVALLTGWTASIVLSRNAPGPRRLRQLTRAEDPVAVEATPSLTQSLGPAVQRFTNIVPTSPTELGKLRRRLTRAGYQEMSAAVVYKLAELAIPALGIALVFLFVPLRHFFIPMLIAALVGFLLPGLVLERLIARRQKVIQNGLPDALDLFVVCLESGSSLDQAIAKASEELHIPYPALAEELTMMGTEMRAGKPRIEVFKNFSDRTGVDDVRALVAMLIQTDRFGTSVSLALRTHAETARTKRRQRAEERAAKVGVKLVFPLVLCLFPGFFVVTVGPAIIQFVRVFMGQVVNK